jgi:hypothetical protein
MSFLKDVAENMNGDTQNTDTNDEQVTFDEKQQAKVDSLLAAERRKGEAQVAEAKRVYEANLAKQSPNPAVQQAAFLAESAAKKAADAIRLSQIEHLFNGDPAGAIEANQLGLKDKAQYKKLSTEYKRLKGILPREVEREKTPDTSRLSRGQDRITGRWGNAK